jgi:SAM-dependent methyltransferase
MFSKTAGLYDLIYGQFKDYAAESEQLAALLQRVHPTCRSVLDVACGTGEHARQLRSKHGYAVDGLDAEPEFVRIAAGKNPEGRFTVGDMMQFDMGSSYDAVLCLFSAIGYARTSENVTLALRSFRSHLARGGLVIVEPWFTPEQWQPGTVHMKTIETETVQVCRMNTSLVRDGISVLDFHYLIGAAGAVEHRHEVHELGLFTTATMRQCFEDAGLQIVEYDAQGLTGRGLYIAGGG